MVEREKFLSGEHDDLARRKQRVVVLVDVDLTNGPLANSTAS